MEEKKFKATYKPASCTQPPWASLIPSDQREEVLRRINRESIEAYGHSMDECSKRKVCFTKTCLGRELPWLSPTAKPYLEKMKLNQKFNDSNELVLSNCDTCSLIKTCTSSCTQMNDFLNRDKSEEPELLYRGTVDNITLEDLDSTIGRVLGKNIKVPWDSINKTRREVVKKYLYEQKDFLSISKDLGLHDQSQARYEFYAALTILSEYGTFRAFLEKKGEGLTKKQKDVLLMVYVANLNITQVAKVLEVSKQSVQQIINRVVIKHNLKWNIFVKREGKKLIYNVPEILK